MAISMDDWKSFSSLMKAIRESMLKGWLNEPELRHMLYVWLTDHDMPCPELGERRQLIGTNAVAGNGCSGIALERPQEFRFDAETGLLTWATLTYFYFGHAPDGQGQPGSGVFDLNIQGMWSPGSEPRIEFGIRNIY